MEQIVRMVLDNFPILCLIIAVVFALFTRQGKSFGETLTRYLLLLPIGLAGLWGFFFHALYPEAVAQNVGWSSCQFQSEIAMANLGMGLAGFIGFWRPKSYALAVIIMASCFLWGTALIHIQGIVYQGNYAPGNAGTILFSDILTPIALWFGYYLWKEKKR